MPWEGDGNQVQIPGRHGNWMREDGRKEMGYGPPPTATASTGEDGGPQQLYGCAVLSQKPQHFRSPQRQSWEQGDGDVPL